MVREETPPHQPLPTACPPGFFKVSPRRPLCSPCPEHSLALENASTFCVCQDTYARSPTDPPSASCTRECPSWRAVGNWTDRAKREALCGSGHPGLGLGEPRRMEMGSRFSVGGHLPTPLSSPWACLGRPSSLSSPLFQVTMSPSQSPPWSPCPRLSSWLLAHVPIKGCLLPYCYPCTVPTPTPPHPPRAPAPSRPHSELPHVAGPPSAPRDLQYSLSRSPLALRLRWLPPADSGGRSDVTYSLLCLLCGRDGPAGACQPCGPRVAFVPRQAGLRERAATLLHLRPGARYTVRVAALNGVSGPAAAAEATYAQVTVSTGPGGKATCPSGDRPPPQPQLPVCILSHSGTHVTTPP